MKYLLRKCECMQVENCTYPMAPSSEGGSAVSLLKQLFKANFIRNFLNGNAVLLCYYR